MVALDGPSSNTLSDVCVKGWHVIVLTPGLKQSSFVIVSECMNLYCLDLKTGDGVIIQKKTVVPLKYFFPLSLFQFFIQRCPKNMLN